jgi:hypothetical protein
MVSARYTGRMATRPSRPRDLNQLAKLIVNLSTGEAAEAHPNAGKDSAAIERGRAGGIKGGAARRDALSERKRIDIARKAAKARWNKAK